MRRTTRLCVFLLLLSGLTVQASPNRVRPNLMTYRAGIVPQALGSACFAMNIMADALPCNPADIARSTEKRFKADLFFGNNLMITPEVMELLRTGQTDDATLEDIFSERRSSELQGQLELSYRSLGWGVAVVPIHLYYQSYFRNEALTEARLLAFQEESINWQWGRELAPDLSAGFQARLAHRRFITQKFFLADAYSESGKSILVPEDQSLLYLEPGILYHPQDNEWRPRLGVTMVNLAITSKASSFSQRPQFHFSADVAPMVGEGILNFGLDLFVHEDTSGFLEALTLGAAFDASIVQLFASYSNQASALGVRVPFGIVNFAVALNNEEIDLGTESTTKNTKTSFLLGLEF